MHGGLSGTYVVVSKYEPLVDLVDAAVLVFEPLPVLHDCVPEDWPFSTTHESSLLPLICRRLNGLAIAVFDLLIEPCDDLLASLDPFVPILPHEWTGLSLFFKKINTFVKLAHTLGNLLGGVWLSQLFCGERFGIEELLEAPVGECAEKARPNALACKALQYLELGLPIDEMLYLWTVDPQQELTVNCQ